MDNTITALEYAEGIVAIDSGLLRPQMAACYLLETDDAVAVVETGVNASTARILSVLARRGRQIDEVSHVIVTHVHLDHAGGAGSLMRELPSATLVAHPRGARHLIDPSRLEASARGVYGDEEFDAMYGALVPVPEERVRIMEDGDWLDIGGRRLEFMDSPGHARHHFCVWDAQSRGWFSGDAFGISYRDLDSPAGPFIFPTTTPVQFDPPAMLATAERLLERNPEHIYLTHFGRVSDLRRLADDLRAGVEAFVGWGETFDGREDRRACIEAAMSDWLVGRATEHGAPLPREDLQRLFRADVDLNTQGIEYWLDHGR